MPEAIWAEFAQADDMNRALHALRERGHTAVKAFSPFPIPATVSALEYAEVFGPVRLKSLLLPWVALVAGLVGGTFGYFWQWFTNAWAYPQNAGGRPANAIPAFVFNTFESLVLAGSCAVFLALLLILRLPRLSDPLETIDGFTRTTDDSFGILVADQPPFLAPEAAETLLRSAGATTVRRVELT